MNVDGVSANVHNLLPQIRQRCGEIEEARRLPRDLADKLRQTEMFSLGVPRAIGGKEATPLELMRTIETVSAADGSTGWCAMVGIANNISAGYMTEQGAREVFADPSAPTAGIAAPAGQAVRVDGGVRVSGRWPFASGVTHSDWLWAGCLVMEGDRPHMTPMGPEIIHACMPVGDVTIHDTWHVSGLRGTGSEDVSVEDTLVPDRRTFPARPERAPGGAALPDATSPSLCLSTRDGGPRHRAPGARQSGRSSPRPRCRRCTCRCWRTRLPCMWTSLVLKPCWAARGRFSTRPSRTCGRPSEGAGRPPRVSLRWVAPHRRMPWTRPQP